MSEWSQAAESGHISDAIDPLGGGSKGTGRMVSTGKMDGTAREASVGVDGERINHVVRRRKVIWWWCVTKG